MSDKVGTRPNFGKIESPWDAWEKLRLQPGRRRLVEECEVVWVYAVQRAFGKKALIAGIRETRPFRLPVPGGYFDIWLVDEPHRLPGGDERWSSLEAGTARLWLICPGCRRKVAKLYYYHLVSSSPHRSDALCRQCHGLTYQSVNCGGNRWYKELARPMKRLLRQKAKLLLRQQNPSVMARLMLIDNQIRALLEKVKSRTYGRTRPLYRNSTRWQKRRYRDVSLLQ